MSAGKSGGLSLGTVTVVHMTEVEVAGRQLKRANQARSVAMEKLSAAVRDAAAQGVAETELARQAGVDRMTVRRILGKR